MAEQYPENKWLLSQGHNNGGRCEKCWSEARLRVDEGFGSVTDAYYAVMDEWQERAREAVAEMVAAETERTEAPHV